MVDKLKVYLFNKTFTIEKYFFLRIPKFFNGLLCD